jgi:serine protease Do
MVKVPAARHFDAAAEARGRPIATSPGSSGGPLLDAEGRVLGVVTAKSPNENLNYALPIGRVLDASGQAATFDIRYTIKLPNALATQVATLKTQFALPKKFADFAAAYQKLIIDSTSWDQQQPRATHATQMHRQINIVSAA